MPGVLPTPLLTTGGGDVGLAIDASTPAFVTAAHDPWTTASFTPPNNSLLVVAVMGDWFNGTPTLAVTSTGLTFTSRIKVGANNAGVVELFTAEVGSNGGSARTVSATTTLTSDPGGIKVWVVTGQHATSYVDTTGSGSSTTNAITPTVLTTGFDGCWVFGGGEDWNNLGLATSTDTFENGLPGGVAPIAVRKATATSPAGAVTLNFDASGTSAPVWRWAAISIRPADSSVTGSAAVTQDAQTSSASGQLGYSGTSAATEAADTSSATGTVVNPVTGTSATTQANQTSSASGQLGYSGTSARTQANQTSNASGQLGYSGTSARTQANQTSTASGAFTAGGSFSGTVAVTQSANTSSASGTFTPGSVTGIAAVTQANQTPAATGKLGYSGTLARLQANNVSVASGVVSGPVAGSVAVIQANQVAAAAGQFAALVSFGTSSAGVGTEASSHPNEGLAPFSAPAASAAPSASGASTGVPTSTGA